MRLVITLALAFLLAALLAARPGPARADSRDAHRVIGILDYVSTDYALAVRDGKVVSRAEHDEQLAFVETARTLVRALRGQRIEPVRERLLAELDGLQRAIRDVRSPAEIARRCRTLRGALARALDLRLAPSRPPSLERARELFAQACAECHGPSGRADGPRARELKPPPASFHAPERADALSPYRVFNTLSFGVPNTAMPSFEDSLTADDRWSLAFYVVALRHAGKAAPEAPKLRLGTLAARSDAELRAELSALGIPDDRREGVLAALRSRTAFEPTPHDQALGQARVLVDEAVAAFLRGNRTQAARHATDAYLQGFEPLEVGLRVRDAGVVRAVETAFTAFRRALDSGDAPAVRRSAAAVHARLEDAEALLAARPGDTLVAFAGGFLILFREGLEAALLIGALLGVLARLNARRAARAVHLGWLGALAAGGATYAIAHGLLQITAGQRELMEGILSLLAAAILFWVSYWLIARSDVQRWMAFLKTRLEGSLGKPRGLWSVAGIAFIAVYREAFETVLFYQALLVDARGQELAVALGAASAGVSLVVAVLLIFRLGKRLP